jgi:predicted  nucleic acid-binding Zn-ribbon protein
MVKMSDLRVCTNCSNVFSRQGGMTIRHNCPHCGSENNEKVSN